MRIQEIASCLDTQILQPKLAMGVAVDRVIASDRMSDLLAHAAAHTLMVTGLATRQVLDVAELMDAPALCIVAQDPLPPDFLAAATACRVPVLLSRLGLEETRRRLSPLLGASGAEAP